ncbi:MAG: hypothetical protein QM589_06605 [Thermomicrobiales bacterium]
MVQRAPVPTFDQYMVDRVILFLQTRDREIFPFTRNFDDAKMTAFVRDLRDGLADLSDSGSKRGTSSTGFPMNDWRLRNILDEWAQAGGDWPQGTEAASYNSVLGLPDVPQPLEDEPAVDFVDPASAFESSLSS